MNTHQRLRAIGRALDKSEEVIQDLEVALEDEQMEVKAVTKQRDELARLLSCLLGRIRSEDFGVAWSITADCRQYLEGMEREAASK